MAVYRKTVDRATITDCIQPYNHTVRQTYNPTNLQSPLVKDPAITPQALALFRLLERLARRTGYACVKLLETLAGMLEKSVRAVRYALAELIGAGWIRRQQTRKGGVSKLFFWPMVRVAGRSRGLFSAPPVAGCSAASSPVVLQVTPSAPIKKTPVGKEDDNRQQATIGSTPESKPSPDEDTKLAVAVSLLKTGVSEGEALELAREAEKHKLTEEQVKRVIAAYRTQAARVRNRGAWLREALRRGFAPPAPAATHPSEVPTTAEVVKVARVSDATLARVGSPEAQSGAVGAFMAALTPEQIQKATEEALGRVSGSLRVMVSQSIHRQGLASSYLVIAARRLYG